MATLGTTLFSFTPDWRRGEDATSILERVGSAGCGPALEVIGHQAWRGFPAVSADDERAFRAAVDRLALEPVALGVYPHPFRRPGAPAGIDEMVEDLTAQLGTAKRLGFRIARTHLGLDRELIRRVAAEADRLGVVLTFEVQGTATPDAPAVVEVLELQQETGSPYLGFTMDFSVTSRGLPDVLDRAFRRLGLADDAIAAVHRIWAEDWPIGRRIGTALGEISGHPQEQPLTVLVAGVLGRCGRTEPAEWAEVLPLAHHAHAKIWDPDVEAIREPHGAWLAALDAAGYHGAVVSEWGGHEMLDRAEADALTVTRDHLVLLAELSQAPASDRGAGMTMAEGMVRPDALSIRDGRLEVAVHLPWYRSLPLSCLEGVEVSVDGAPAPVSSVRVPGFAGTVAEAATSDVDWDLRDALDVALDREAGPGAHALEVTLAVRIPYLQTAPGVALVQRATARTEGTLR